MRNELLNGFQLDIYEDIRETNRYDEDGERILRYRYYVRACAMNGRRYMSNYIHESDASANSERRHLRKKVRDFNPVALGWEETWPVYGSQSWGQEHEDMLRELDR